MIELPRDVIWLRDGNVCILMTIETGIIRKVVVTIYVTLTAFSGYMASGERECCRAVIEHGGLECRRVVTARAIVIELSRHVIRRLHSLIIRLMALITIGVDKFVIPIRVALRTNRRYMFSREWKLRRGVIEVRWFPGIGAVTLRAIMIESAGNVIRFRYAIEIHLMTSIAIAIRDVVITVRVTALAIGCQMFPDEWKFRRCVIECRWRPCGGCVAFCAIVIKLSGNVRWSLGALEIRLVALITIRIGNFIIAIHVTISARGR